MIGRRAELQCFPVSRADPHPGSFWHSSRSAHFCSQYEGSQPHSLPGCSGNGCTRVRLFLYIVSDNALTCKTKRIQLDQGAHTPRTFALSACPCLTCVFVCKGGPRDLRPRQCTPEGRRLAHSQVTDAPQFILMHTWSLCVVTVLRQGHKLLLVAGYIPFGIDAGNL